MELYIGTSIGKAKKLLEKMEAELKEEKDFLETIKKIEESKENISASMGSTRYGNGPEEANKYIDYMKKTLPGWIKREIEIVKKELEFLEDEDEFIKSVLKASKKTAKSALGQKIYDKWAEHERNFILQEYGKNIALSNVLSKNVVSIREKLGIMLRDFEKELELLKKPNEGFIRGGTETAIGDSKWWPNSIEESIEKIMAASRNMMVLLKDEKTRKIYVEKSEYVTREIIKLIEEFGGRVEYGNMRKNEPAADIYKNEISWNMSYDFYFFSGSAIFPYSFSVEDGFFSGNIPDMSTGKFYKRKTDDPKEVVEYYRKAIESIPKERKAGLKKFFLPPGNARVMWAKKIPLFKEKIEENKAQFKREVYTKKEVRDVLEELKCPKFYMEDALSVLV